MKTYLAIFGALFAGGVVHAHGAHVHGTATLAVALDGERLELQLDAPGDTIVGFERSPRDDAERTALADARALLATPARWIALPADAACVLQSSEVDFDLAAGEHAAFDVQAAWRCATPNALTVLDVTLFASFPRLQRVTANLVLPDRQDSRELTPRSTQLRLAP
jgi:hypothetical protein